MFFDCLYNARTDFQDLSSTMRLAQMVIDRGNVTADAALAASVAAEQAADDAAFISQRLADLLAGIESTSRSRPNRSTPLSLNVELHKLVKRLRTKASICLAAKKRGEAQGLRTAATAIKRVLAKF